jgi:hypothetical protein
MIVKDLLGKKIAVLCRNKEILKFLNICYDQGIKFPDETKAMSRKDIINKEAVYLHLNLKAIQWADVSESKKEDFIKRDFTLIEFSELLDHIPEGFRASFEHIKNQGYFKK